MWWQFVARATLGRCPLVVNDLIMKILDIPRSGSIAGTVSSHNRAGQYVRNRRAPVQPIGTGRRATVRGFFASAAAGFALLTTAEQDAWTSFAAMHPITDSLGQSVTLTGQQMYVRVTASALNAGVTPSMTPPADVSPANIAPASATFSILTGLTVTFNPGPATQFVTMGLSQPVSAGRRFWKTFWQPPGGDGFTTSDSGTLPLTTALYAAQFGAPVVGNRVFTRLTSIGAEGFNGPPVIISCIVTA